MVEEKKQYRYKKIDSGFKPIVLDLENNQRMIITLDYTHDSKNDVDYKNIVIVRGYNGTFGFNAQKFNGSISIPSNISDKELTSLFESVKKARDNK